MGENHQTFLGLRKGQAMWSLLVLNLIIVAVSVFMLTWAVATTRSVATQSHDNWCSVKANSQSQIEDTNNYLKLHPGKEPIPGISRQSLLQSVQRLTDYRDSISVSDCPK